jgi:uncharacterized membrane protein
MARAYWLAVATVIALISHILFVLYLPPYSFARQAERLKGGGAVNRFFILDAADRARLFPGFAARAVVGFCRFDVASHDVVLHASLPQGIWVATIYTDRGEAIYSVNNRQSGSDSFSVSLSLAPGLIESLMQVTRGERPEIDSGWSVLSPRRNGFAVLWYPLGDMAEQAAVEKVMAATRCEARPRQTAQ